MNDAQAEQWRPMKTAPKDGTIVRLLVDYRGEHACHPLEDAPITHTIGGNTDGNTGLKEGWKFAGWSWEQDCFCEGRGKPIGWLPFGPTPLGVPAAPKGYKLVPLELTPDMEKADPYGMGYGRLQAIWSRLLAAAPVAGVSPSASEPFGEHTPGGKP